jgi:rare lipoprotein A (peptidoglycan hydrolase)
VGRHRQSDPPKTLKTLRLSLVAVAGLAAIAVIAITASRPSSAQPNSRAVAANPPRPSPDRASRDEARTPLALPTPTPEPTQTPTAQPVQKKHQHRRILSRGACEASYYAANGHTASGEAYDPAALTAAHRTLPIGSKVRVTNKNNDRSVVVRINDRGPFVPGRCLDLSSAAMHAVGGLGSGVIPVRYEVLAKI